MVILCRTFPDQKPAEAACEGIKALTTIMQQTKTSQTRVTAANYIAALSHTRPGPLLSSLLYDAKTINITRQPALIFPTS